MSDEKMITDKKGREVCLRCSDPTVYAFHGEMKVGELAFQEHDDGLILSFVEVKTEYRRAGIGVEMIRYATECVGDFALPGLSWNAKRDDQLHTTHDGRALLNYCFRVGILSKEQSADYREWHDDQDAGKGSEPEE